MTPKLSNLNIVLGYWNENSDSCFRFYGAKDPTNDNNTLSHMDIVNENDPESTIKVKYPEFYELPEFL